MFNKPWSEIKRQPLPPEVDARLGILLTKIDDFCGGMLYVHRLHDPHTRPTSQHFFGRAADIHILGMHVLDQFVLAERFSPGGLGVYPKDVWTYTPGLHVDVRSTDVGRRWAYRGDGEGGRIVMPIGKLFFKHVLSLDD